MWLRKQQKIRHICLLNRDFNKKNDDFYRENDLDIRRLRDAAHLIVIKSKFE